MHEWMADNGNTPHIVVDVSVDGVTVPDEHVKDGKIILNISDSAAHNLKLTVVAEGVETEEQLAFLQEHDCDEIQGFLFSEPRSAADVTKLLEERRSLSTRPDSTLSRTPGSSG